jgi:hypothetical protein
MLNKNSPATQRRVVTMREEGRSKVTSVDDADGAYRKQQGQIIHRLILERCRRISADAVAL